MRGDIVDRNDSIFSSFRNPKDKSEGLLWLLDDTTVHQGCLLRYRLSFLYSSTYNVQPLPLQVFVGC